MPLYRLNGPRPRIHPTAFIHPDAVLIGDVTVGAQSSVWAGAVLRADFGQIRIGERTSIQDGTVLHTTEDWPTVIGNECVVGHNTHLEGCTVEDRCLIGSGSVTLNRAVVRRGSIVGAQALVPEGFQVPACSMVLGVPAKIRRPVDNTRWIDYGVGEYLRAAQRYRQHLTASVTASPSTIKEKRCEHHAQQIHHRSLASPRRRGDLAVVKSWVVCAVSSTTCNGPPFRGHRSSSHSWENREHG